MREEEIEKALLSLTERIGWGLDHDEQIKIIIGDSRTVIHRIGPRNERRFTLTHEHQTKFPSPLAGVYPAEREQWGPSILEATLLPWHQAKMAGLPVTCTTAPESSQSDQPAKGG